MDDLRKNHQVLTSLIALHNVCKLNCILLMFFHLKISITWLFYIYYCTVTFVECVHLYKKCAS